MPRWFEQLLRSLGIDVETFVGFDDWLDSVAPDDVGNPDDEQLAWLLWGE